MLAGGHTHTQMLRRYRDMLIVNPGSVGLPFEHTRVAGHTRNPPWAEYAVVSYVDGRLGVDLRRTPVDIRAVVRASLDSKMPHMGWWARDWEPQ